MSLVDEQPLSQAIYASSGDSLIAEAIAHNVDSDVQSVSPISRLPKNLLSQVMMQAYKSGRNALRVRLTLSWVSRHWRRVALGDARLWTCIDIGRDGKNSLAVEQEYTKECIMRSKQLPLQVNLNLRHASTPVLETCLSQIHRIQKFTYDAGYSGGKILCTKSQLEHQRNFWSSSAPQLTSLELGYVSFTGNQRDFLANSYPRLKSLSLWSSNLDWNAPLLSCSTLTTLAISKPDNRSWVNSLANKLALMPLLVSCSLSYCFVPSSMATASDTIHLRSLRRLYLQGEHISLLQFLGILGIPAEASVEAQMETETFITTDVRRAFDTLRRTRPYLWGDIRDLEIHATSSSFTAEVANPLSASKDCISFQSFRADNTRSLTAACDSLAISNLETLSVRSIETGLYPIFGRLQHLKSITFGHHTEKKFIWSLFDDTVGKERDDVPLPSLTELCFDGQINEYQLYELLAERKRILQRQLTWLTLLHCSQEYSTEFEEVADEVSAYED